MELQNIFHWLYVAGMALGAIYLASLGRNPRGVPRYEYFVATFIPIWSGLAYMSMSLPHDDLEQGKIAVAGQITHFARYLDWIITTPLLLLALSWTAMHFLPKKDWTLIGSLMATQVIVIATGLIADLSVIPWVRYLWYICGVVAFLVVLWGIWGPLQSISRKQGRELSNLYNKVATDFTVLWICYPIVWIIGPSGFRLINQTFETALFCIIPFFSKVGFSVLDLHGLRNLHHSSVQTPADRTAENLIHFMGNLMNFGKSQRLPLRKRV
ncbi:bacteriorhodopsin [Floridanema aerugineum]|uniref:Bacteriorhodopsin n=1 Tax=Floridaenema aerugineum BLCC-F46 TaxID=3153654 RepID=A0ABV4X1Y6_9CYAN